LILEVHPHPSEALSDGAQTLTPAAFLETMHQCRKIAEAIGKTLDSAS
jgi:3-deoxy-7-phosphoheptulonate synthase